MTLALDCPETSNTGAFQLSWSGGADSYELRELAPGGDSVLLYSGADSATALSGRTEGVYRYLLTDPDGGQASCAVEVAPPSTPLVAGLFVAGLVVTAATVALVIVGYRRTR